MKISRLKNHQFVFFSILLIVLLPILASAKIWRINNRTEVVPITRHFSTLAEAFVGAASGDTLHVEPSNTPYDFPESGLGGKRFVFIGNGYFLTDTLRSPWLGWEPANYTREFTYDDWVNEGFVIPYEWDYFGNSSYQWYDVMSTINMPELANAAALMNGSKFTGIRFTRGFRLNFSSVGDWDVNVLFQRCFFDATDSTMSGGYQPLISSAGVNYRNVTFRQCFFYNGGINYANNLGTVNNLTIENCLFFRSQFNLPFTATCTRVIVRNNTILVHPESFSTESNVSNCYFVNNIVHHGANVNFGPGGVINDPTIIRNNLFTKANQPQPGNPATNVDNITRSSGFSLSDLFYLIPDEVSTRNFSKDTTVQVPDLVNGGFKDSTYQVEFTVQFNRARVPWDAQYRLVPGSAAIGSGRDGVTVSGLTVSNPDIGAFGGPDPYKVSGIPEVPTIYRITAASSVIRGCVLEVTVGTRGNN